MAGVKGCSGGARVGAGRKPKTRLEKALTGHPGHGAVVLEHPSSAQVPVPEPIDEFGVPDELTLPERQIWLKLAPHALTNRTLTKATELSFTLLCRNVVLEQALAADVKACGGANHRGLIQRVDAELAAFSLRPFGKPIFQEQPQQQPANPLAKFLNRKRG